MNDKKPQRVGHENLDYEETPLPQPLPKLKQFEEYECRECDGRLEELTKGYDGEHVERVLWCASCGAIRVERRGEYRFGEWAAVRTSTPAHCCISMKSIPEADAFRDRLNKMFCDLRARGYTVEEIAAALEDLKLPVCKTCGDRRVVKGKQLSKPPFDVRYEMIPCPDCVTADRPLTKFELDAIHLATDDEALRERLMKKGKAIGEAAAIDEATSRRFEPGTIGLLKKKFGGHYYPGAADGTTSDCAYNCGCWAGRTRSGGPDGVDPMGECPKNPLKGDCKHERTDRLDGLAPRRRCLDCGQRLHLNMNERCWYAEDGTPGPMMRPPGSEPHKGADDDTSES